MELSRIFSARGWQSLRGRQGALDAVAGILPATHANVSSEKFARQWTGQLGQDAEPNA